MDRAIVITGASSGIGAACALDLDRAGFRVFAGVRREADGIALKSRGSERLQILMLDVTVRESIAAASRQVADAVGSGGIAGLVNNAGVVGAGPLEFLPVDELRAVLEVNVVGPVAVTQAFVPLIRQGRGRLVFMSSLSGRVAAPLTGSYCASKFALEALSDVWRLELRAAGIPVAVIEPGVVATPIWNKSLASFQHILNAMPAEGRTRYARLMAGVTAWAERGNQSGVQPEEVARAVRRALVDDTPKLRYAVGRGSRLYLLSRFLPDRVRDRMLLRALGALP